MLNWFKKHFIPHAGNDHRPHFLRKENIRNVVLVILFLEIFTFLIPTLTRINMTGGMAAVLPAILADLTNEERQAQKLETLSVNPILNKAAEMKARDMATKGYFAHTSPEGKTPWYWLTKVGYKYQYAGENLAVNFTDSQDVTNAWMDSPTHKANIVKGNYTEIGTGIASGLYEGRETVFVAQVYANPLPKSEIIPEPQTETNNIETNAVAKNLPTEESKVLGALTTNEIVNNTKTEVPTFIDKIIASPRSSTNTILYIIIGVISIAILLTIFVKIRHQHFDLITNGLVVIIIIGAILLSNYYLSNKNTVTLDSMDYSYQNI